MSTFPRLLLRDPAIALVDLPWEMPLADWPAERLAFRDLPVGPSRHLVRFLTSDGSLYALKELPLEAGRREYDVLLRLESAGLPAVSPAGLAEVPERSAAILATEYLAHSLQYRRLLMRLPPGPSVHRDRLLDAMAFLLVDLHRNGVYWGDCSLANTLFRRDGDRIQAYLVDAETSEVHPALTRRPARVRRRDPRRERRLRPGRPRRDAGRAGSGRVDRRGRAGPRPLPGRLGGAPRRADPAGRRPPGDPGPGPPPQRSRLLGRPVRRPDGRRGPGPAPDARHDAPVPRPRDRAADEDPGARGPGPAAAQRPERVRRVARAPAGRPGRPAGRRRRAGCATCTARRSPGSRAPWARVATSSRPTATCSSRSGTCPRRPVATSASTGRSRRMSSSGAPAPETPPPSRAADATGTIVDRPRSRAARRRRPEPGVKTDARPHGTMRP